MVHDVKWSPRPTTTSRDDPLPKITPAFIVIAGGERASLLKDDNTSQRTASEASKKQLN